MIRYSRLEHKFVDDIPEPMEPGFLYVSMRYATAMHLCCCGCGREIATPFSPAQWSMSFDGESVSLHPSIGNWNLPCRSHYVIINGGVFEASPWSDEEVSNGQEHDRRRRSAYHRGAAAAELKAGQTVEPASKAHNGWLTRIRDFLAVRH